VPDLTQGQPGKIYEAMVATEVRPQCLSNFRHSQLLSQRPSWLDSEANVVSRTVSTETTSPNENTSLGNNSATVPTGMLPPAPEPEAPGKHPYHALLVTELENCT
jgi:hypothetical protein